jgi:hypothetical protein
MSDFHAKDICKKKKIIIKNARKYFFKNIFTFENPVGKENKRRVRENELSAVA